MGKLHIKVGDTVEVTAGNEKGQKGKVVSINKESERAIVEGRNMVTKHRKPSADNPQGGIDKTEAPIHISNLMLVDASGNATRIGRRKNDDGKTVRYSKKTGEEIK